MSLKEKPFWMDTLAMPEPEAARPWPGKADVAIIGSGFTGLSAARALARRGVRVVVLEAETIGWGASSRNGGMVLTGLKLGVNTLIARYGRERTRRMFAASIASIDCVEQIVRDEAIECDFSRSGHLEVACKPAHYQHFVAAAEAIAREFNHTLRVIPKSELHTEIGSETYYGGLVDEVSAGLNPARYVAGLARAAAQAGADLRDRTRVDGLERSANAMEDAAVTLAMPRLRDIAHRIAVLSKRGELAQAAKLVIDLEQAVGTGTSAVRDLVGAA